MEVRARHDSINTCHQQAHHLSFAVTDSHVLVRKKQDGQIAMMAIMSVDRNRQYYVATRGSTQPSFVSRDRWQQGEDKDAAATLEKIEFFRPDIVSQFHRFAGKIDEHNRIRHDILRLTKTWKTKRWDVRVNMTILGMIMVDSLLVHKHTTGGKHLDGRSFFR